MNKFILLVATFIVIGFNNLVAGDISTYLVGDYISSKDASDKLKAAGFEVVTEYSSVKDGVTIVFTNSTLKTEASKQKRAFAAVLRMFVDNKEKMISVTNPVYFGKAFMQDDYRASVFESQLASINKAFPGLKGSKDMLDADDISGYHFMMGMPYYEDVDELATGKTLDLLEKAKSYKKGKFFLFSLKLNDDSYLVGYDLGKRTKKFVKKIGRANAAVLPYVISIEKGVASSLEAKYYLAVSYPLLSMGEFTTIATVPGAIKKDLAKPFKK